MAYEWEEHLEKHYVVFDRASPSTTHQKTNPTLEMNKCSNVNQDSITTCVDVLELSYNKICFVVEFFMSI